MFASCVLLAAIVLGEPQSGAYYQSSANYYEPPKKSAQPGPSYCDPRLPPKCANHSDIYCLRDYEYPLEEIQVRNECYV